MKRGITIAGNMLVDNVKRIPSYPGAGMLADIEDVCRAVGGCVPNTAIDLARMKGCLLYTSYSARATACWCCTTTRRSNGRRGSTAA